MEKTGTVEMHDGHAHEQIIETEREAREDTTIPEQQNTAEIRDDENDGRKDQPVENRIVSRKPSKNGTEWNRKRTRRRKIPRGETEQIGPNEKMITTKV